MDGRDTGQLMYRWAHVLDPSLRKGHWSVEEDQVSEVVVGVTRGRVVMTTGTVVIRVAADGCRVCHILLFSFRIH